jgi:Leucine-rich repeat (LRR) protein
MTELPDSIGNLINVKELHLRNNKLRELPDTFCNLLKLEELTIRSNSITKYPHDMLRILYNDTTDIDLSIDVYISDNSINKELPPYKRESIVNILSRIAEKSAESPKYAFSLDICEHITSFLGSRKKVNK